MRSCLAWCSLEFSIWEQTEKEQEHGKYLKGSAHDGTVHAEWEMCENQIQNVMYSYITHWIDTSGIMDFVDLVNTNKQYFLMRRHFHSASLG